MSHTYVILEISPACYHEIRYKLKVAGYEHAFDGDVVDMHGIALQADGDEECSEIIKDRARQQLSELLPEIAGHKDRAYDYVALMTPKAAGLSLQCVSACLRVLGFRWKRD